MSDPSPWITVGELARAFAPDSNAAGPTGDLVGRTLDMSLENHQTVRCRFLTHRELSWETLDGRAGGRHKVAEQYLAYKIRPAVYFVDFVRHLEQAATLSFVLDLDLEIVTVLFATLPDREEASGSLSERVAAGKDLTAVSAVFLSGAVDKAFAPGTPRHLPTVDLIGRRVEYAYSPSELYEHIYLNERFYTWQCLAGAEEGLADTDRCHYYKVADDLYFFVWREKIIPTLGAAVIDFGAMRSTGKIFGYAGTDFDKTANFAIGARARFVNVTKRSPG
jgi:hypothetical protein